MLSSGFFPLSLSLTTVISSPYPGLSFGEITETGSLELAKGANGEPSRMRVSSAVTQVKRSARNIHYGIGGVKIDRTVRAAPRNAGVFRKKTS
jgi:hypothetical protein